LVLERAAVGLERRHSCSSFVVKAPVTPGNARVVKAFVAERGPHVAGGAVALAAKDLQAGLLFGRERRPVAIDEAVIG